MAGMIRGKDRLEYMREELWMIKSRDATAELEMTEAEGKITGKEKIRAEDFFNFDQTSYDLRGHCYKLATQRSRLEVRQNYFRRRLMGPCNRLPCHVVEASTVNNFKN